MTEKPTYEELEQRVRILEQEKLQSQLFKNTIVRAPKSLARNSEYPALNMEITLDNDIDISRDDLKSIINVEKIQLIMDEFYSLTHMVTAILDLEGNVIESTGWQDICTKFHRVHPETARNCTQSDLFLAKNLKPGQYVDYKCKNGLWDVVTPLYIGGRHLGNIFTGQFFYEDDLVDEAFFMEQANFYGFEKEVYMDAYRRIPKVQSGNHQTSDEFFGEICDIYLQNQSFEPAASKGNPPSRESRGKKFIY